MPVFICPNCKERSIDSDGYEGFTGDAVQCRTCGFGFLFQLLEDFYPAPTTGFVVCDASARVLATGRGVFELTGYREQDLLGRDVADALGLSDTEPLGLVRGQRGGRLVKDHDAGLEQQRPGNLDELPFAGRQCLYRAVGIDG